MRPAPLLVFMGEAAEKLTSPWPMSRVRWSQPMTKSYGGFIGYGNLSRDLGKCITPDDSAPCSLTLADPSLSLEDVGGTKLLYTMWESRDFPRAYVENIEFADVLIVPSRFCHDTFKKHFPKKPIHLLSPAVDSETYTYRRRKKPRVNKGEKFRWLWVNAPDVRKGYHMLAQVWEKTFMKAPWCELYLKTTNNTEDKFERRANAIFDSRFLPKDELVDLYHSAHGFIYPTWGEGFGYTLAEAMATGLPSVATNWSGQTDFMNPAVGYPVDYDFWRVTRELHVSAGGGESHSLAEDMKYEISICKVRDMIRQMATVMDKYSPAVEKAQRGARLIRRDYTLEKMAAGLHEIVERYS